MVAGLARFDFVGSRLGARVYGSPKVATELCGEWTERQCDEYALGHRRKYK